MCLTKRKKDSSLRRRPRRATRSLQFAGTVRRCDSGLFDRCRLKYLKRFPYAVFKGGEVWLITPDRMKYTDNRLGFGKKLLWERG